MPYIHTIMATGWTEQRTSWLDKLSSGLDANPSYRGKHHLVRAWLIEFDEDGAPWREIALDENGAPLFAGPSNQDYGFWLDTNMRIEDFAGEEVAAGEFERLWTQSGVTAPSGHD